MEFNRKNKKNLLGLVCTAILFYFALQNLTGIGGILLSVLALLFPFLLGGAIAFILNVPMKQIENKLFAKWGSHDKLKRPAAYLLTLLIMLALIFLALFVVIPELLKTGNMLIEQIPASFERIQGSLVQLEKNWPDIVALSQEWNVSWEQLSSELVKFVQSSVSGLFSSTVNIVSGAVSAVVNFFVGFTFSIYILFQKEKLCSQCKKLLYALLPMNWADRMVSVGALTSYTFSHFLSGQCLEAVILGLLFFLTMNIFGMPYALLVGVVISVTALIPIFGAFIGLAIGTFLIVMVNPLQAIWFIVLFLVLQQLEGNLIYPYVVGGSIGLPSIWVLAAVTLGGKLMGIAGMLIFIPLCSVLYILLREFVLNRIEIRKIPREKIE